MFNGFILVCWPSMYTEVVVIMRTWGYYGRRTSFQTNSHFFFNIITIPCFLCLGQKRKHVLIQANFKKNQHLYACSFHISKPPLIRFGNVCKPSRHRTERAILLFGQCTCRLYARPWLSPLACLPAAVFNSKRVVAEVSRAFISELKHDGFCSQYVQCSENEMQWVDSRFPIRL